MKSLLSHMLAMLICIGCQSEKADNSSDAIAEIDFEKEKTAIMAVIEGESAAFWNKDYDQWTSYWYRLPTYGRWVGGKTVE